MEKLKKILKTIKENKYDFSGHNVYELTHRLIEDIGCLDGEVRDMLLYPVLAHLLHDDVLLEEQLEDVTTLLISKEYLFFDINNEKEFSVLTRSFTLLQLAIIVYKYNNDKIITEKLFKELVTQFTLYLEKETDYRGFVKKVGWCHSIAHSADLFKQLSRNDSISIDEYKKMLNLFKDIFKVKHYQFIHDEDERFVTALEELIKRNIFDQGFWIDYISSFKDFDKGDLYPEAYNILFNMKKLVR